MEKDKLIAKQQEEIRVLRVILNNIDKKVSKASIFNVFSTLESIKYYLKKGARLSRKNNNKNNLEDYITHSNCYDDTIITRG